MRSLEIFLQKSMLVVIVRLAHAVKLLRELLSLKVLKRVGKVINIKLKA